MNNAKAFGSVLARVRKEKGFSSAHQFFKSIGGSKSLGLAFVSYWDIERGKKLPKSWRLEAIMAALGIEQSSPAAKELVKAYFKSLSGSDKLLQILSVPAEAGADLPSRELIEAATQRAVDQVRVNLTLEQWKLCSRDQLTHICMYFLFNTSGWVTVGELSETTGFKPEAVRKTLKALAAGGLIEFSGDKVRCQLADKTVTILPETPATAGIRDALINHMNEWLADAKRVSARRVTVRMSKANMEIYRQHLEKAANLAYIYCDSKESRQDSDIYLVDASIFRFIPKK